MPQCYQAIVINAPIDKIWDTVKNFHDLSWGTSVIEKCEPVGEKPGTEVGAKRVLNGVVHQTLLECNEQEYRVRYSIDEGDSSSAKTDEVKNYISDLHLIPVNFNNSTFVAWSSSWDAVNENAVKFFYLKYNALLTALANHLEGKY